MLISLRYSSFTKISYAGRIDQVAETAVFPVAAPLPNTGEGLRNVRTFWEIWHCRSNERGRSRPKAWRHRDAISPGMPPPLLAGSCDGNLLAVKYRKG